MNISTTFNNTLSRFFTHFIAHRYGNSSTTYFLTQSANVNKIFRFGVYSVSTKDPIRSGSNMLRHGRYSVCKQNKSPGFQSFCLAMIVRHTLYDFSLLYCYLFLHLHLRVQHLRQAAGCFRRIHLQRLLLPLLP